MIGRAWIILMLCGGSTAIAQQPSGPATQPREGIVIREWVILVSDPYQPVANAPVLFGDTLPEFIQTRRPRLPAAQRIDRPMPIGVIRYSGPPGPRFDLQLDARQGTFMAHWPVARVLGTVMAWRDVTIEDTQRTPPPMDERHWLQSLRNPASRSLVTSGQVEQFLLYDVSLPFPAQLSVGRGSSDDSLKVAHAGYTPLRDLVIYRPEADQAWSSATLPTIAPPAGATPPRPVVATAPPAAAARGRGQTETQIRAQIEQIQLQQQAIMQIQAQQNLTPEQMASIIRSMQTQQQQLEAQLPKPPPVPVINPYLAAQGPGALDVTLARSEGGLDRLLAEWRPRLASYDLPDADVALILRILQTQIEQPRRLAAVYRMDDAELNRLMPVQVVPNTASVKRVALVIVKNIDPAIPTEIAALVARLGDNDWKTREAATRELATIGPAARGSLQAALTSPDAEISLRAERLLAGMMSPTQRPLNEISDRPAPILR